MGNKCAAGKPPANEMISGRDATFNISRTALRFISEARRAKRPSQFISVAIVLKNAWQIFAQNDD